MLKYGFCRKLLWYFLGMRNSLSKHIQTLNFSIWPYLIRTSNIWNTSDIFRKKNKLGHVLQNATMLLCMSNPGSLPAQDPSQPEIPAAQDPSQPKIPSAMQYWFIFIKSSDSKVLTMIIKGWLGPWPDMDLGLTGILGWLGSQVDWDLELTGILGWQGFCVAQAQQAQQHSFKV